jgi:hypothetical protein
MNQAVTEFIQKNNQIWQIELCASIRETIHESVPDVTERIQYGKPHFLKDGRYLCVLGIAKAGVSLTIFNASKLNAPKGFFEPGGSPERKTLKLRQGAELDHGLLRSLLQQAVKRE